MKEQFTIIDVNPHNISQHPPLCFMDPRSAGGREKQVWFLQNFNQGLRVKLLCAEGQKKPAGFIEYVPGEFAWRAVDAEGYLFIHCIWVSPNKFKNRGLGSLLIEACRKEAQKERKLGLVTVSSAGPFMAGKSLFLKNGFRSIASSPPSHELLVLTLKKGPLPRFRGWQKQQPKYQDWQIVYSNQCPWVARFVQELAGSAEAKDIDLKVTEQKTAAEAQDGPSLYSVFTLLHSGRVLADHYISRTRFKNILKKEPL